MTVCACVYKWQFHTKKKKNHKYSKKIGKGYEQEIHANT